jgi:hypothetical protein
MRSTARGMRRPHFFLRLPEQVTRDYNHSQRGRHLPPLASIDGTHWRGGSGVIEFRGRRHLCVMFYFNPDAEASRPGMNWMRGEERGPCSMTFGLSYRGTPLCAPSPLPCFLTVPQIAEQISMSTKTVWRLDQGRQDPGPSFRARRPRVRERPHDFSQHPPRLLSVVGRLCPVQSPRITPA